MTGDEFDDAVSIGPRRLVGDAKQHRYAITKALRWRAEEKRQEGDFRHFKQLLAAASQLEGTGRFTKAMQRRIREDLRIVRIRLVENGATS